MMFQYNQNQLATGAVLYIFENALENVKSFLVRIRVFFRDKHMSVVGGR